MVENTTLVTMPQMIDLALNCPELGTHNFNVLHTLLHVLLRISGHDDVAVEFRGPDSDKVQNLISVSKPSPIPVLSKYNIIAYKGSVASANQDPAVAKKAKKASKKISLQEIKQRSKQEVTKEQEIQIIERRKDSKDDPDLNPPPLKSPPDSKRASQNIIVVDSASQLPQFSVAMTKDHFDALQQEVKSIKKKVMELTELPANMGLIEATRTSSGPILDMFQILNLTKRMDACETSMEKLVTLIEDLARADQNPQVLEKVKETKTIIQEKRSSTQLHALEVLERRLGTLEKAVAQLGGEKHIKTVVVKKVVKTKNESESTEGPNLTALDLDDDEEEPVEKIVDDADRGEIKEGAREDDRIKEGEKRESRRSTIKSSFSIPRSVMEGIVLSEVPPTHAMALIQEELQNVKAWIEDNQFLAELADDVDEIKKRIGGDGRESSTIPPEVKFNLIESKFSDCMVKLQNLDRSYNSQLNILQEQLVTLQKEVTDILERLNTVLPGGDSAAIGEGESAAELYDKLAVIEQDITLITEAAKQLEEEKELHAKNIEAITEQIDLLKIIKANREDLEDALGDKADACMINRKVSHDQFDAAYDDLSKGIEDALNKLAEQQEMWQQALHAIQREIGNKLDKAEVSPLRDFVNSKLKALQDKFRSLTALKREQEAAGTKSKFLRNVACISCDKDVVMRKEMDPTLKPQPYSMPPNKNIAPYLAYELDQLRKQQKCVPGSKNLNFYESALKSKGSANKSHICNRYCGGSHTVTTPQQRVTRLGHFLEQWGPEISPVNDEYVKGKDNQMYKARDDALLTKLKQETQALTTKKMSSRPGSVQLPVDTTTSAEKPPEGGDAGEARMSKSERAPSEAPPPRKMSSKQQNAVEAEDNAVTKDVVEQQEHKMSSVSQQRKPSRLSQRSNRNSRVSEQNIIVDTQAKDTIAVSAAQRQQSIKPGDAIAEEVSETVETPEPEPQSPQE